MPRRLTDAHRFGEMEALLTQIGVGEYVAQILGGIPMSQSETVRFHDLDLEPSDRDMFASAGRRRPDQSQFRRARARALSNLSSTRQARAISATAARRYAGGHARRDDPLR